MDQSQFINYIIAWEDGSLDEGKTIELFKFLVETGRAWTLQGFYGRTAIQLIQEGIIPCPPEDKLPWMVREHLGLNEIPN
jgi:hypothetical protein